MLPCVLFGLLSQKRIALALARADSASSRPKIALWRAAELDDIVEETCCGVAAGLPARDRLFKKAIFSRTSDDF
ncbi:hypothetical protein TMatcc_005423 [Talaromyces marneffei ATCC 18224]